MKYNKHIVFLTVGFPNNEGETDCIPPMQNFIKAFAKKHSEIKISVISLFYPFNEREFLWNGIPVYALGIGGTRIAKLFKIRKVSAIFESIYNKEEETVIQSFWLTHCALVGEKIANKYKIKHFCMAMGQDLTFKNKFRYILPKKQLKVICPNSLSSKKLKTVFKRKATFIIPRGIDESSFKDKFKTRDIDILGVGNFGKLKNYESFLRIVKELKKGCEKLKIVIIGKGEQESLLKHFVKKNHLSDNVIFLGHVSREEVIATMLQSKILLHTSSFEDESYAITEALYAKMYVVGYENVHSKRENLYLGKHEQDLITITNNLLKNYQTPQNKSIYTLTQMINDFHKIYFS